MGGLYVLQEHNTGEYPPLIYEIYILRYKNTNNLFLHISWLIKWQYKKDKFDVLRIIDI